MKNILSKWNITPEELNQATDELEISAPARADKEYAKNWKINK